MPHRPAAAAAAAAAPLPPAGRRKAGATPADPARVEPLLSPGRPGRRTAMRRSMIDILACPIDKHYPLDLFVVTEGAEIDEGVAVLRDVL